MSDEKSIFSKIIDGEIPGDFVYQDDVVVAIRDINPLAAFHVLIIPREPLENAFAFTDDNHHIGGHMMLAASKIAAQEGLKDGFRLIINNGEHARQEVYHIHMHMLAGEDVGRMVCK